MAVEVMAAPVVDWETPFMLPEPPDNNQGSSSSCVSFAWSNLHWQLQNKDYSRRDLYSRIYLPQGGAYIRDGGLQIIKKGQATRDEAPDPLLPTENEMRDGTGITDEERASDIERDAYVLPYGYIDYVAAAIKQYGGVVSGFYLSQDYYKDPTYLRPPAKTSSLAHSVMFQGYQKIGGIKHIVAKSSWCGLFDRLNLMFTWPLPLNYLGMVKANPERYEYHHLHYIPESYFLSGMVFNPWTLISRENKMAQIKTQNFRGELRIVLQAADMTEWKVLTKVYGKNPDVIDETVPA